jgi:hypothetical protein
MISPREAKEENMIMYDGKKEKKLGNHYLGWRGEAMK